MRVVPGRPRGRRRDREGQRMLRNRSIFVLLSLLISWPAMARSGSVVEYDLAPDVAATLGSDGVLVVTEAGAQPGVPRLVSAWDWPSGGRPQQPGDVFTAVAREGDPGGHRGFSPHADDDGDGRTDEDPLDGVDNDGDGRIDEDFAAISHRMGAWSQDRGPIRRRVETYHWTWPQLETLVAARFVQAGAEALAPLRLRLTDRTDWQQLDQVCLGDDVPETGPLFLAAPLASGATPRWLGVVVLDPGGPRDRTERIRTAGHELQIPLRDGEVAVAVASGVTRLQVIDDLAAAARLFDGMTDPVTGRQVGWLPAAARPRVPADRLPAAEILADGPGRFELRLAMTADQVRRFDPDLFRLADRALGIPRELVWQPAAARGRAIGWPDAPGAACDPYAVLEARGAGVLRYRFAGSAPGLPEDQPPRLAAVLADGRAAELPLALVAPDTSATPVAGGTLRLAPRLLSTFPNPFRVQTRVRFEVPTTAGEAYVWEGDGPPPFEPQQRLPFADGGASVSVRIYSVEGKEVATLFAQHVGPGIYEAAWDGRDRIGRTVASGAYICKLQIENSSVTKQLIFVR